MILKKKTVLAGTPYFTDTSGYNTPLYQNTRRRLKPKKLLVF